MIFYVLRQFFAVIEKLFELRMGHVARHDNGAVQRQSGGNRMCRKLRQNLLHRTVQIDADNVAFTLLTQRFRNVLRRIVLQFFYPDPVTVDFGFDVAVSRAGDAHADRAGGPVARKSNHANIMGKVFTAELRT
ncbi:hypothetical protein D3C72_1741810 [compost metagenome]